MSTSVKNATESIVLPGGWTPWSFDVTPEQKAILQEGVKDVIGGFFQPVAVTSQVVAGVNYAFICEVFASKMTYTRYIAMVQVHKSLDGTITRYEFVPIGPYPSERFPNINTYHGYSFWNFTVSPKAEGIFNDAMPNYGLHIGYKPLAFTTQSQAGGTEYVYLAEQIVAFGTPKPLSTVPYFIYIFAPENGGHPVLQRQELIRVDEIPHLALQKS